MSDYQNEHRETLPGNMKPVIPDLETLNYMLNNFRRPKMGNKGNSLYASTLQSLRVMDEQDAVNKGKWYNLPYGITQELIERIMYFRYTGAFFYLESMDRFFFLPYVGKGLNVIGQYLTLTPLPFNGSAEGNKEDKERPWIQGLDLMIQHDFVPAQKMFGPDGMNIFNNSAVILTDYTKALSQKATPRVNLQEPLLQVEAEIIPFLRTALLNGTGVDGIRINSIDEAPAVAMASNNILEAAINGERWVPLVGTINTEELGHETPTSVEDYLVAMQSIDNLRLAMHGITNGGLFQKKAHMLQDEQNENSSGMAGLVMEDMTRNRQEFCTRVNSIWGLGMWYEPSETALEGDMNMDGMVSDEYDDTTGGKENGAGLS